MGKALWIAAPALALALALALAGCDRKLAAATGAEANNLTLDMQRDGHKEALDLHRRYAANGDMPSLKTVAASIAPVVQQHLDALAKLPKTAPAR